MKLIKKNEENHFTKGKILFGFDIGFGDFNF